MMNRFFAQSEKVTRAISILELLCQPQTSAILDCLREWPDAAWIDLLIHTQMDADLLQDHLELMEEAGLIEKEMDNYSPHFKLSRAKLKKVSALVR
jgi:DNA-binding HxlR family transcriptional regulator